MSEQSTTIYRPSYGPGCLLQLLWFIFIGWWLGLWAIGIAWLLNITIIGLPLGLLILNNIPMVIALQSPKREIRAVTEDGKTVVGARSLEQYNFFLRALYFIFIGWWFSLLWLLIAYLLCATIFLLPIGLLMFRQTPFLTTLKRY